MEHKGLCIGLYRSRADQCSHKRSSLHNAIEMLSTRTQGALFKDCNLRTEAISACEPWLVAATSAPWEERGCFTMVHSCNAGSFTATLPVPCLLVLHRARKQSPSCSLVTDRAALTVAVFEQPGNKDCGIAAPQCA